MIRDRELARSATIRGRELRCGTQRGQRSAEDTEKISIGSVDWRAQRAASGVRLRMKMAGNGNAYYGMEGI